MSFFVFFSNDMLSEKQALGTHPESHKTCQIHGIGSTPKDHNLAWIM